jgi:sugar/nucleoside kinase (ribokinase family)
MNIAAVGHATIDIFLQLSEGHIEREPNEDLELCIPFPTKIQVPKRQLSLGGNSVNVGSALLRDSHTVKLISRVGQDVLGSIVFDELKKLGFDLTYTSRNGESNMSVILNFAEDRTILSYHSVETYRFPESIKDIDWVYLTSLGFEDYEAIHTPLLGWLEQNPHVQLMYNPGKFEVRRGFPTIEGVAKRAHTLIVNLEEARSILLPERSLTISADESPANLLRLLIKLGVQRVIITDGKNGAYYAEDQGAYFYVRPRPVPVSDATGAGDAFSSGYMIAVLAGIKPNNAMLYGIAQSAGVIQQVGATNGVQDFAKLDRMVQSQSDIVVREVHYE